MRNNMRASDCTPDYESKTVEVRKAENGFIKRVSHSSSKGYASKETVHKTHPGLEDRPERIAHEHAAGRSAMSAAKAVLKR